MRLVCVAATNLSRKERWYFLRRGEISGTPGPVGRPEVSKALTGPQELFRAIRPLGAAERMRNLVTLNWLTVPPQPAAITVRGQSMGRRGPSSRFTAGTPRG